MKFSEENRCLYYYDYTNDLYFIDLIPKITITKIYSYRNIEIGSGCLNINYLSTLVKFNSIFSQNYYNDLILINGCLICLPTESEETYNSYYFEKSYLHVFSFNN